MSNKIVSALGWIAGFLAVGFLMGRFGGSGDVEMEPADFEQRGASPQTAKILARHMNRFGDSLKALPAFQNAIEDAESEEAAFRATAALSFAGLGYLPPTALDSFARLKLSLMKEMSTAECAQMATSGLNSDDVLTIYGRLDTVRLKRMLSFGTRSSFARFSDGPAPEPTDAELGQAWRVFVDTLGPLKADRFSAILDAASPSNAQLCWVEEQIWSSLPELPADHKLVLIRSFTRQAVKQQEVKLFE